MKDLELIYPKVDKNGKILKKDNSIVYEKVPLIRHISIFYFGDPTRIAKEGAKSKELGRRKKTQIHEFTYTKRD
jgi:hypothetical protein